jgi:trigger factor
LKVTQEEVVERQVVLNIELEDEDVDPYLDRGYRRVVGRTMIPGFRKGKAPRFIVERYLGRESLLSEVMDSMLPDATQRAITTQELETAGTPRVEVLELDPVTIKATVALVPDVDLGAYRDIRVDERPIDPGDDSVDQRLQQLRERAGTWEPVERPVRSGDMVTMDVAGTVEGSNFFEQEGAVHVAEEESVLPFPGFSGQLVGMEVGTAKEFTLTVSEDHADSRIAGKEAVFNVTISEVKEQNLPELDDEFAKSLPEGYESLEALREAIDTDVQTEAESARTQQYREDALDALIATAVIELPPLLIDHEVEHMVDRRDRLVDQLNIRMDDYLRFTGKTEDEIQQEMKQSATERLSRSYALSALAEEQELKVSDEEIDEKVQELAASAGDEAESLQDRDLDSEEVRSSVRESLLVAKALDRLTSIVKGEQPEAADADVTEEEDENADDNA